MQQSEKETQTQEEELFLQYLEVCNKALEANRDKFPYKQLWEAAQTMLGGKTVSMAVYDDHPKVTYNLKVNGNGIDIVNQTNEESNRPWHVNMSYLEKVVSQPEEYIKNPAKIDWDWLQNRMGN